MSDNTSIEWTDATWNPLRVRVRPNAAAIAQMKGYASLIQICEKMQGKVGHHCEHVSEECLRCYAERDNHRCRPGNGTGLPFDRRSRDLIEPFVDERILKQPLRWKEPRKIFVQNQTDLFGEWWPEEFIDRVFAVMSLCPQHTFQILTKRPEQMRLYLTNPRLFCNLVAASNRTATGQSCTAFEPNLTTLARVRRTMPHRLHVPIKNTWLGVSCGTRAALSRIETLRQTPAAVRFVSFEPLLEDLGQLELARIHWAIVGGESGPGARPMHPVWIQSIRNQCIQQSVRFFFKQWGEYGAVTVDDRHGIIKPEERHELWIHPDSHTSDRANVSDFAWPMVRVGKKKAGALLDGREWREFPEVRTK